MWDRTIVLPESGIGELAAFARRRGDTWFVGVLNGPVARTLKINLGFLAGDRYDALVVRDKLDDPAAVAVERFSAPQVLTVDLRAAGGFVARFTPNHPKSLIPNPGHR